MPESGEEVTVSEGDVSDTQNKSKNTSERKISIVDNLKSNQLIALLSVSFYLIGFMITNLFLSAFGVVNFTLFRARYILSGLLFSGFVFLVVFPLYGFFKTYMKHEDNTFAKRIVAILSFTLYQYFILLFAFTALLVFGSAKPSLINLFPAQSQSQTPFSEMILSSLKASTSMFLQVSALVIIIVILIYVLLLAFLPIAPFAKGQSRQKFLKETLEELRATSALKRSLTLLLILFVVMLILSFVSVFLKYQGVKQFTLITGYLVLVDPEMYKFFIFAFLIYAGLAAWFFYHLSLKSNNENLPKETKDNAIDYYFEMIPIVAWGILLFVPLYTFNIYPSMPQQIGGGKIIEVDLLTTEDISNNIPFNEGSTYLIDRYSAGGIFLFIDKNGGESVIEISGSELKGIIHPIPTPTQQPTSTPTPTYTPVSTSTPSPAGTLSP